MQNQISDHTDLCDRFVPLIDSTTETNGQKVYDYALDGLRGLAAIWVAYSHIFFYNFKIDPAYHPAFSFGYLLNAAHGGILIFFALSGYVIGLTNRLPFSKANAVQYVLRRFIRLYPIYIIAIISGILAAPTDTWKTILGNFLFLQAGISALLSGNGVLWTLHYEVVYYIAFLAIWYFRPKVMPLVIASLIVACLFPCIPLIPPIISGYAAGWVFWLFGLWLAWKKPRSEAFSKFPLLTYILLYIATDKLSIGKSLIHDLGWTWFRLAEINITDFIYFPLCALLFTSLTKRHIPYLRWLGAIAIALPLFQTTYLAATGKLFNDQGLLFASIQMILGLAIFGWNISSNVFSNFSFFGSISYGIYVFHMPIMNFMQKISIFSGSPITFILRILIWAGLTIGISYILELKVQPILKKWFQQKVINQI